MEVEVSSELVLPNGKPLGIFNGTTIATGTIATDPQVRALAREVSTWIETARAGSRPGGMFDRAVYVQPDGPYAAMKTARHAALQDDIISGVMDATEALAFDGGLKWESSDPDDADVFNQLSADINLDAKIREMWRESMVYDQFVCAKVWDTVEYTVRGKTEKGNKKKRKYRVFVPRRLVLLNNLNVVPIGHGPLREDRLAWRATTGEFADFDRAAGPDRIDPLMTAFFNGRYQPTQDELHDLNEWGVPPEQLLEMNRDWVFRHCTTRPDYAKFADLRMRSLFGLLDLKRQLMASDRAMLVGAANYILLIRKGSDDAPATQEEVTNLKANYNFLAKLPVIISDHRLEIDVIAPKLDFVLKGDAYDTLDRRILTRALSAIAAIGKSVNEAAVESFDNVLASAIQNRRHMIKRTLERELAKAICDHPRNEGLFEERPSLVFTPRTVSVGTSQAILTAMLTLRTQREISRDTILEYLGLDQDTEAQRLELEEKFYDDIFKTAIPFNSPANQPGQNPGQAAPAKKTAATPNGTSEAPAVSGARGGRPTGGGATKQSPQKQAKPRSRNGNVSTKDDN